MKRSNVDTAISEQFETAIKLSDWIFDHPETGRNEYQAQDRITSMLSANGFSVEKGVGSIQTSFRAVWENGQGGPSIGLLCEYDALNGFGHGCGHHMQGPAVILAAIALKQSAGAEPFRIVVYGTPDEEDGNGKITMKNNGCFQDIDIALMTHGGPNTTVDVKSLALKTFLVRFHGTPSHAALNPENGRSAVDAMLLSLHGLEMLREHVKDDVRMHYEILHTSPTYNVVPDFAEIEYVIRSYSSEYLETVAQRLERVIQGAAYMTETTVEIEQLDDVLSKIPVPCLNEKIMNYAQQFSAPQIIPFREKTGSTDFGNVLHSVPGACVRVAFVPEGTPSHSEGFLAAGKSHQIHDAIALAARILANVSADYIEDESFATHVRQDFEENLRRERNGL